MSWLVRHRRVSLNSDLFRNKLRWQDCGAGPHGTYHDKEGRPLVNKTRFPDMGKMVSAAHGKGVSMGW